MKKKVVCSDCGVPLVCPRCGKFHYWNITEGVLKHDNKKTR